jgi:ubiquinone/menaquinone biosynthesis C-methylase UbiE
LRSFFIFLIMNDNTKRFSNRVDNYVKYRPSYPKEIISFFEKEIQFNNKFIVADIGSGTGILSRMFLDNGNTAFGIEPNEPMRERAEELLKDYTTFKSVDGTAEQTKLENESVDLITAAQAFHWFDAEKTKTEFKRILKPNGYCCLIWNERLVTSAFEKAYEKLLLDYAIDYTSVNHKNIDEKKIAAFFAPHQFMQQTFNNKQIFDFEGLKGRLLSSSYTPDENHPKHNAMIESLMNIYSSFNQNNTVQFDYETKLYLGRLF